MLSGLKRKRTFLLQNLSSIMCKLRNVYHEINDLDNKIPPKDVKIHSWLGVACPKMGEIWGKRTTQPISFRQNLRKYRCLLDIWGLKSKNISHSYKFLMKLSLNEGVAAVQDQIKDSL